jgi:internalin A
MKWESSATGASAVLLLAVTLTFADEINKGETPVTILARTSLNLPTNSGVAPGTNVIRDRAALDREMGEEAARRVDNLLGQPRIDFTRYMVICVSGGNQRTSGYRVDVNSVSRQRLTDKSQTTIRWSLHQPRGIVLQVLTTPAELLLVERTDGASVFERINPPRDSDAHDTAGATDAEGWKTLLKSYQALALPLPPADAPLVATLYEMVVADVRDLTIPLHRPQYLLGFLVPPMKEDAKVRLLIGTELIELDADQVQSLIRIDPAGELPGEIMMQNTWADFDINAGLPTAIQCYQRGWTPLADRLLAMQAKTSAGFGHPESVFYQPAALRPELALKFLAWADCGNRLASPGSDRTVVLKRLQLLSASEPNLQTPQCWGLIQSISATVQPGNWPAGSIEKLVDDLIEMQAGQWDGDFTLGFPDQLLPLARQGLDALPVLLKHIDDRRLTRGISHPLGDTAPRLISVGEVVGKLLQQLAGDEGVSWTWDQREHFLEREQVATWWNETQKLGEEGYLVRSAVPRLPRIKRTYTAIIHRLLRKYPQHLPDVYRRLLVERPDVHSWELLQAIAAADLTRHDKIDLFIQGAQQPCVARQAEALEAMAAFDEGAFETFLIKSLVAMPRTTEQRYVDCEQVALAQLCWKTNSLNVWHPLRDSAGKADVGVRMEIIDHIGDNTDLSHVRKMRVAEFLLNFLEDSTLRNVTTEPEKYDGCAAAMWKQIEVRNWAAYQLAKRFSVDVSAYTPGNSVTSEDWERLRSTVARVCEERRIEPDYPSPNERIAARQALQDLGGILLESDRQGERRLTEVNLAQCEIKDADLRHIRFLEDVEVLNLSGTSVTDAGLKYLAKCIRLRVIFLPDTRITDAGLAHLSDLTGLRRLDLSHTAVTDRGVEKLAGLIHLEQLDLSDTEVSDAGLAWLPKLLSLEHLSLKGTAVTDSGFVHLASVQRLANLDLTGTGVTDAGLPSLGHCQKLESLTLSMTKVTDAGLSSLTKLSSLQRLYLFGLPITDKGTVVIGQLRGLNTLSLTSQNITDEGVKSLCQLQDLEILSLPQTSVTDQGVQQLVALKKLARLDLGGTAITDRVVESLKSMLKLERVVLSDTKVTAAAKQELLSVRPGLNIVE